MPGSGVMQETCTDHPGLHNALGITAEAVLEPVRMLDRPFTVAWADFPNLLCAEIRDPAVADIADGWPVGPVDQFRHLLWPAPNPRRLLRMFHDESQAQADIDTDPRIGGSDTGTSPCKGTHAVEVAPLQRCAPVGVHLVTFAAMTSTAGRGRA